MTKIALCGAGMISGAHALVAQHLAIPVVAVASRTTAGAAARAEGSQARVVAYGDLPAGADVVIVSTPPPQHAEHALAALRAGAAVVLEKPLCATLAEADELVAAGGDRLGYAENLAYSPVVTRMLELVGGLGPLTYVEARSQQARPTWGGFLSASWGGGALFDLGVHPLAVVLLLAAPATVVSVSARLGATADGATDEHAEVDLVFDTGLRGHVVSSWRGGPGPVWDAQAASATGVVRAELLPVPELERDGEPVALPPATMAVPQLEQYGYVGQLRAFTDDFATGRRPRMDVTFGRTVLDVVCAAYASAGADGAAVAVPFTGPRDRTPLELWRGG